MATSLKTTYNYWQQGGMMQMGAALAFYFILSIAPLLAVLVGLAGLVIEQTTIQDQIVRQIAQVSSQQAADAIRFVLQNVRGFAVHDLVPTLIGLAILLIGATNLFVQMQAALNRIFQVPKSTRLRWLDWTERYLLSLMLLIGLGLLLVLSIALETSLQNIEQTARSYLPNQVYVDLWRGVKFIASTLILTILLAAVYKVLPSTRVKNSAALKGGAIAGISYSLGTILLGVYFNSGIVGSAFGAASTLMIVLLWVYFAAQIFLFGAIYTKVLSDKPGDGAI